MILVPCCTLKRDENLAKLPRDKCVEGYKEQFDVTFISKVKDAVLHRLGALDGLEDLRSNIVDEVIETPATYADSYNLAAGTPFALVSSLSCKNCRCVSEISQMRRGGDETCLYRMHMNFSETLVR